MPLPGTDTFTGVAGSALSAHVADVGLGGLVHSGLQAGESLTIDPGGENEAEHLGLSVAAALFRFIRYMNDMADDACEVQISFVIVQVGGVMCLMNKNTTIENGHGCAFYKASATSLVFDRRDVTGAVVQTVVVDAAVPGNGMAKVGMRLVGTTITPFRINTVGVRVSYAGITVPDLRDGNHRRLGIILKSQIGNFVQHVDNFAATAFPWSSPAAVAGVWASPAVAGGSWASG
jgi:hypothetical protein